MACNKKQGKGLSFELIPRNSYFIDAYQGIEIYRFNDDKKLMDGYFVVGNEGVKWEEFNVEEGILNGDYILYHSNGKKFTYSKYKQGKKHGEEKTYYISGALKTLKNYSNGVLFGKNTNYFESGQIQSESKIEKEKIIESISYDIIGGIQSQMFIKDGRKITQNVKLGKIYAEHIVSTYDDFDAMKFYNEDGSLKVFIRMFEENERGYLIELNENEEEIKRIDIQANPEEILKYQQYLAPF
ncbi:toxin-antitoxin system YwqK family antitoxin [Hyunsoonleella sp. 2307UL5-6]|uniref:toxin-antitoxin system YwqK family antitoxin n=1 Tax=Hyunsoonleella sp. 2307UL5-6 TaxID=3384768 RepID=UPI0039BD1A36